MGESVDQAEMESNIKCRNYWSGRRLNEYSVGESKDQADMELNIEGQDIRSGHGFSNTK